MIYSIDLSLAIKAIILGLVEGLTEFIPVSSTAHLLIASKIINFSYIKNNVFEIAIQLGAIIAVCFLYRKKLLDLVLNSYQDKNNRNLTYNIAIGFLPAAFLGFLFHKTIKSFLFSTQIIALALIFGGLVIIIVEKYWHPKSVIVNLEKISKFQALGIGLFQAMAMIPGISRSGATIIGGLFLKLDRKTATEFSFFLAIPTIFGAVIYDLYKNFELINSSELKIIAIGFLTSFLSSILVIKWFINFVSNHKFLAFAYYRIIIGIVILIFLS